MSSTLSAPPPAPAWKWGAPHWVAWALALALLLVWHHSALEFMVATWQQVEEYSYGWFVPCISAFLIWQRSDQLRAHALNGSWWGLAVLALGLLMGSVGELSAIRVIGQYGFVVGLCGLVLAALGPRGLRLLALPLAMLLFMVPLPQFVLREVSHALQLLSSELGVALIRAFGISVHLAGNVIDLGAYKLQVVEACNGLRYLFPLMVLGTLAACFFQAPMWQRVLLVVSTVPLTIAINSLRIGLIGVTVEYWGSEMAEGLVHDLEGWFMFLICLVLLALEMRLLARLSGRRLKLGELLLLDAPAALPQGTARQSRRFPAPLAAALAVLLLAGAVAWLQPQRAQQAPPRESFASFPLQLPGGWDGRSDRIAPDILAALALTDYHLANYARPGEPWVNFYVAYYASQSGGESSHSPRTCIPGDGWSLSALEAHTLVLPGGALTVNRTLIQKGDQRQLVYYWFRQRGRHLTGEFAVKWHILADAITRDRSDGALVRVVTPLPPGEDPAVADRRLLAFVAEVQGRLGAYVPD